MYDVYIYMYVYTDKEKCDTCNDDVSSKRRVERAALDFAIGRGPPDCFKAVPPDDRRNWIELLGRRS